MNVEPLCIWIPRRGQSMARGSRPWVFSHRYPRDGPGPHALHPCRRKATDIEDLTLTYTCV
jgi:hypothetical protein